jgi:hypothetical protein
LLRIYFPRISEFGSASKFRGGGGWTPQTTPRYTTVSDEVKFLTFIVYAILKLRCKCCSGMHAAHLKWRYLSAPKIYLLLISLSRPCHRRKVFRMTSESHHNGWIALTIKKEGGLHCEDSKSCSCNFCHLRNSKKFKRGLRLSELNILSPLPWT